MAHKPEKKAAVVADLCLGMTQHEAADKHRVSRGTIAMWATEHETNRTQQNSVGVTILARRQYAEEIFTKLIVAQAEAFLVFAELCKDKEFVREKPEGAARLSERTTDFLDRCMARARSQTEATGDPDRPN